MSKEILIELAELEKEIDDFTFLMINTEDKEESELYRQMLKVNIALIKNLLSG